MTKEQAKAKVREMGISSSEFLDRITEFLSDTSGRTNEELRKDLEANGIDVDAALARTKATLRKHGFHKAAERMQK